MNVLLDTCSFLWAISERSRLSATAHDVVAAPETRLFLSAVSVWEIALKYSRGAIVLPQKPSLLIPSARDGLGVAPLDLDEMAALSAATLPLHHRDPFDRMLVCQAMRHDLTILTPDRLIRQYGVRCLW